MTETYRIRYTPQSAEQLQKICQYIARDSPGSSRRLISRILRAIRGLEILPHRFGSIRHIEQVGDDVRFMPVRPYLIRYCIDDKRRAVTILTVHHGARRPGL